MRSRRPCHSSSALRWLGWWLLWLAPMAASAPVIPVDANFQWADLAEHIDILTDPTGHLDAAAVLQSPLAYEFAPARPEVLHFGDRTSVYWLRFAIANSGATNHALMLTVRPQRVGDIHAYELLGEHPQVLLLSTSSDIQLDVPANSQRLFLLRVNAGGLELAQLELHSIAHYIDATRNRTWLDGLSQGGLLMLALSALLLLWLHREQTYFWLAAHTIVFQGFLLYLHSELRVTLIPQPLIVNSFEQPIPATLLLVIGICSLRLAQRLPVAPIEQGWAQRSFNILLIVNVAAIPLTLLLPQHTIAAGIVSLTAANVLFSVTIALYNFVDSSQRYLLAYVLIRTVIVFLVLGAAVAWNSGSAAKALLLDLLPLALLTEGIGLLTLLVSRSRQHEREQTRADRSIAILEAEGRSRTEIVAEVGHRARTPISGVLGMLDMLQDTPLSAAQRDYLNTIRRAGNELLNVVDDMNDLSRLQNHSVSLQQTVFDPHGLVAECVDGFRSLAAARHLELINDPAPGLPAFVSGDPTRLRQLILQLLHRELGRHERGDIVIRIELLPQPNWLRFHLETLARRAQSTPSEIDRRMHTPGSANVRTAIARQLIELLGGRFGEREFDEQHAELWFDLPLPSAHSEMALEQNDALRDKQLLVIDDSPTFCEVLRRQATHWGMTVHTATSASEGLARLRNQAAMGAPIDALLIDALLIGTDMPELQQSDWFQRLQETPPAPIVLLLSSQASETRRGELGARRVLLKPVNNHSLKIALIEEFKRREKPRAAPTPSDAKPIRCLYAEDNIINAKVLAGMLGKLGVIAVGVDNGQEAVEAVQRDRFDIVLMDCDMPVMDGWEASKRIREIFHNRGTPAIPIIALTANTVEELGERARQPLMDAHLVKPIHLQELRALLENWTGKITATVDAVAE